MTVAELIAELQKHDPSLSVVVDGYEGGLGDLTEVRETTIQVNANLGTWYYGEHEEISDTESNPEILASAVRVLYLPR